MRKIFIILSTSIIFTIVFLLFCINTTHAQDEGYWECDWVSGTCILDLSAYSCDVAEISTYEAQCNALNQDASYCETIEGFSYGTCELNVPPDTCYDCQLGACVEVALPPGYTGCTTPYYPDQISCEAGCGNYSCNEDTWTCEQDDGGPYGGPGALAQCQANCYEIPTCPDGLECSTMLAGTCTSRGGTAMTCMNEGSSVVGNCCGAGPATVDTPLGRGGCGTFEMYTAIGCIPVFSTSEFISFVLNWAIGVAAGVAFLLIVFAGFQIMTSSGNPEKLKAGQELLTSAIMGLILIVFSVIILRIIGFDILGIPGFYS